MHSINNAKDIRILTFAVEILLAENKIKHNTPKNTPVSLAVSPICPIQYTNPRFVTYLTESGLEPIINPKNDYN